MLSKTTNKNIESLESILNDMRKAHRFIHSDDVKICMPYRGMPDNTFINKKDNDIQISAICKKAGSHLQYLDNAIRKIRLHIKQAGRDEDPKPDGIKQYYQFMQHQK